MSTDDRLRAFGFRIKSRPADAEPTWELWNWKGRSLGLYTQSEALASMARHQAEHTPDDRKAGPLPHIAAIILCLIFGAALAAAGR